LSFLDNTKTHSVDILSGAFMLLRKSVLDKIGLLDETFFMYGEDIDLSYRITKAGYKNYYYPEARIIHYKGESTKKNSINYVFVFYRAMVIFAKKHFSSTNARLFGFFINSAIWVRASAAILSRFLRTIWLPILDGFASFFGIYLISSYWQDVILGSGNSYPELFFSVVIPVYILIWLISIWLHGGYQKPVRLKRIYFAVMTGTIAILVLFALLPGHMRFSRAMIFFGAACIALETTVIRFILHFLKISKYALFKNENRRIIIIGNQKEAERVEQLLQQTQIDPEFLGIVGYDDHQKIDKNSHFLGTFRQLQDIIPIYRINEIIFCTGDISFQKVIDYMIDLQKYNVDYKIAPSEGIAIIGSNSIHTAGDLYTINLNALDTIFKGFRNLGRKK
jgi:hypothetical protein